MKRDLANQARVPTDQDEAYQARQQSHKDYGTDGGDPQASEPERAAASVFQAPPSDGEKNYYVSDIASDQNIPSNIRSPAPGQVTQGKVKMMPQSSLKSPGSFVNYIFDYYCYFLAGFDNKSHDLSKSL